VCLSQYQTKSTNTSSHLFLVSIKITEYMGAHCEHKVFVKFYVFMFFIVLKFINFNVLHLYTTCASLFRISYSSHHRLFIVPGTSQSSIEIISRRVTYVYQVAEAGGQNWQLVLARDIADVSYRYHRYVIEAAYLTDN